MECAEKLLRGFLREGGNMKIKQWLKYLIYTIIIFALILLKGYVERRNNAYFNNTFRINFSLYTFSVLINIGIGLIIGLEQLISGIYKEGSWKINIPKVVFIVLPSIYFSSTYYLAYSSNQFIQKILTYPMLILSKNGTSFLSIFQLMFGYFLITSFYKQSEINKS